MLLLVIPNAQHVVGARFRSLQDRNCGRRKQDNNMVKQLPKGNR
jgi:hypothetical protein